jgi:acetyl esterase/lipase
MAKSQTTKGPRAQQLQIIRLLTAAAKVDTAYRDLYLQRAAALLPAFLSTTQYEQLRAQQATLEQLLTQARRAVGWQDWQQVEELTARIRENESRL